MPDAASTAFLALSLLLSVGLPVFLLLYGRRKYGLSFKAAGVGALVWIVFSQILEKTAHLYLLQINPVTAPFLHGTYVYAVYGGLMAGIFEETGRWLAFRYTLRGQRARSDGLAYGIGHGGMESVAIGLTVAVAQLQAILFIAHPAVLLIGGVERVMALAVQIALSLIVLYGVRAGRIRYLFYAILAHAVVDFFPGLYQAHALGVWPVEAILAVFAVAAVWLIVRFKTVFDR